MNQRKWLLWVGLALILLGIGGILITNLQEGALDAKLSALESRMPTVHASFSTAVGQVDSRSRLFPRSYSTGLFSQYRSLTSDCSGTGITETLVKAREAQKDRNQGDPNTLATDAENRLNTCDQFSTSITPYYDGLQAKVDGAAQRLIDATNAIPSAREYIAGLKLDPWVVTHGITFNRALRLLKTADTQLILAQQAANAQPLVDDNVRQDTIAAYNAADLVQTTVQSARSAAEEDNRISREAVTALNNAELAILDADHFIVGSTYNTFGATQALALARASYNSALLYFIGDSAKELDPNYTSSRDTANTAAQQAASAKTSAMTPTPVPPTPTPRPTEVPSSSTTIIIIDGSNDDDSDFFNSDSGNGYGYGSSPSDDTSLDFGSSFDDGFGSSGDDDFFNDDFGSATDDNWSIDDDF